jgi:hypothetical protein
MEGGEVRMTASRQLCVVIGLGLVAVLLTGCGRLPSAPAATSSSTPLLSVSPYPSSSIFGTPPVLVPSPAAVRGADVDAVALAAVKAIEASDTRLDADPNDTAKRASAWLTPAFAGQVRAYPPVAAPGATWNRWAAHHAYIKVTTSLAGDDHPADSATAAYRQVVAVLHPVGRDGWVGPAQTVVVFVTLAPVHGQWRLANEQPS